MPSSLNRRVVAAAIAGITAVAIIGTAATSFADSATSGVSTSPATVTSPTSGKPVTRLAGGDRIGTAIAISQQEFPNGGAGAVILTADYDFADAMSAGPLGKRFNAPLLLTTPGLLAPATLTEIQRVLTPGSATPNPNAATTTTTANPTTTTTLASTTTSTVATAAVASSPVTTTCAPPATGGTSTATPTAAGGTVYIIGGYAAIAQEVDTQLQAAGYNVVRIAGDNRFATSVDVAQCEGSPSTVFLATGDIFADALSAGPAAAHAAGGGSVLLTDGKVMPAAVGAYLATLTSPTVYAIGAAAALADPQATAIFGGDRFATSALVADKFFPGATVVGVATGSDYPDALAGGAFMGVEGGPVLMSDPFVLPSAVGLYLAENQNTIGQAFLFGGTHALSNAIANTVSHLINNQP
jgi:putative cell wall-binding protein